MPKNFPERNKKFHEFAIKSILFKGHVDLYLCYLKAEKIAHVLSVLQARSASDSAESMQHLVTAASRLPETIVHFAAGEIDLTIVLADVFSLLSATRLSSTQGFIAEENAAILCVELEQLAEKIAGGTRLSPFIHADDFLLPSLPANSESLAFLPPSETSTQGESVKDNKGQNKTVKDKSPVSQGQNKRTGLILEFVRKHKSVSIKDIAKVIRDCSEKTIQRELGFLIQQGLVKKQGERRWSVYSPT
jgi:hypothetical protein